MHQMGCKTTWRGTVAIIELDLVEQEHSLGLLQESGICKSCKWTMAGMDEECWIVKVPQELVYVADLFGT